MAPVLVIMANGCERISIKEGSVRLGSKLMLKSVFYVEEKTSDLISLGQLMDDHNAFLHVDLIKKNYMKLPLGFQTDDPSKVCLLQKLIYGLKQLPRCWFEKLYSALCAYGFGQSLSDYSLFIYEKDGIQWKP